MIACDLHTHTCYSHGEDKPAAMYAAALDSGLTLIGFSEHSPRPQCVDYIREYREYLKRHLQDYDREVLALKAAPMEGPNGLCNVLYGMEMDWLDGQEEFTRAACRARDFDYLLGSVHFIGRWGFDDGTGPWEGLSQEECEAHYTAYFSAWEDMLSSGLFSTAAHPDLIKIFSVEQFHVWLDKPQSLVMLRRALTILKETGMSMEISSAGLRKPCAEIYPAPQIMTIAAELGLPVSFASDAHRVEDVAADFTRLAAYARSFGFSKHVFFEKGRVTELDI
ncbi:MAG: histidinol-phosphatase [Desulfovibrio sp.]|jgi:histidinol-phosphatase (PHP family)|nr:histidinol-phosphatase [Desulfovibrio sp.]